LLAAGACLARPCRVPRCAAPTFAAPACGVLGGTCRGVAVAVHTFVAWRGEPCTPVRYTLTAPNDTIESPVNRPIAGVKASRLLIDSLLPPSRESRCRRDCLPARGSFPSCQLVEAFPATLTRHLALSCVDCFEFGRLRKKLHDLDQQQGLVPGVLSWSDPPVCWPSLVPGVRILGVRDWPGPGRAGREPGCAGPPGSGARWERRNR
jgi:hypothetical protein